MNTFMGLTHPRKKEHVFGSCAEQFREICHYNTFAVGINTRLSCNGAFYRGHVGFRGISLHGEATIYPIQL